jgi:hypothetical protein
MHGVELLLRRFGAAVLIPCVALASASAEGGETHTLRVEYVHSGDASSESFALSRVVREGPWPGPPDRWLDETNLGKYLFEVRDRATNRLLYSRGFASVYGEWEGTGEAKELRRAFSESLRFPEPAGPVQLLIKKRDRQQLFREAFSIVVDPRPLPSSARSRPRERACGRCRRAARRATRSTSCCSATATPRPRWTSGTRTRSG